MYLDDIYVVWRLRRAGAALPYLFEVHAARCHTAYDFAFLDVVSSPYAL